MALRHLDFPSGQPGLYGTSISYMDDGLYAFVGGGASLTDDPDPNITGNVLGCSAGGANETNVMRFVLPSAQATVGFGCRLWMAQLPQATNITPGLEFRDGSNVQLVSLTVSPTGIIQLRRNGLEGTIIASSSGPVLVANAWQHIEMKILVSDTVGTAEVRVEGVPVITATGLDTSGSGGTTAGIFAATDNRQNTSLGISWYIKDLVLWDSTGSLNNDFLGSVSVTELLTTSDISLNWTPSTGSTGYNLLDESPPNDETDYIYAADPPPAAAVFGLTDLNPDVTSVKGLYVIARSRKTDGGDGNLQVGLISNGDTGLGTDRAVTTSYTYWTDMFETDPDTSAAWTPSAVDDVQLRLNRTL